MEGHWELPLGSCFLPPPLTSFDDLDSCFLPLYINCRGGSKVQCSLAETQKPPCSELHGCEAYVVINEMSYHVTGSSDVFLCPSNPPRG